MSQINAKTFAASLKRAVTAHGKTRDAIQDLCVFAMTQAGNGNFTYINALMNADFAGADQRAIQKYFEDHCDVTLGRKDGAFAFTNNNTRGFKHEVAKKVWFEYKPTAAPAVIDPVDALLAAVTRIDGAIEHKGSSSIAKGKVKLARELVTSIKNIPAIAAGIKAKAVAKAAKAAA